MTRTALITGVTGQDGSYLAHYLLGLGYRVVGTSRDAQMANISGLDRLRVAGDIELVSLSLSDFRSVLNVVATVRPDEIYNLAGQTSVGLSFEQPVESMESISVATLNILEAIRFLGEEIRFFNAGSSECFGDTAGLSATEQTPLRPLSPYAVAKSAAFWQVATYREAYGLYACTGILANHESPLRPKRFVTQKIVQGVRAILAGRQRRIQLGNLDIWRDWGWAPEYVKAMVLMLNASCADDYLIASGVTTSLRHFARLAFSAADLDISEHTESIESLRRPAELVYSAMNPGRINEKLGWKSSTHIDEIVKKMLDESLF
jgi:GDPmannose 4,6-dehydratase